MFNVTLEGEAELMERLESMPAAVQEELKEVVVASAENLRSHIVNEKLHGQVLHQRSGKLANSITVDGPVMDAETIYGRVFSSGHVKYAAIHEYGGTFTLPGRPLKLPSHLARRKDGSMAMTGTPYTVTTPERSFMRSSLADMRGEISKDLKDAIIRGFKKASASAAP